MRLFLALLFLSTAAIAEVEWLDLNSGQKYSLTQAFSLKQKISPHSQLDFIAGEKLNYREYIGLGQIGVSLFVFDYENCPGPEMVTEMEIIPVKDTYPVVEIGVMVEEKCSLEIYIEDKDIYTQSIFE